MNGLFKLTLIVLWLALVFLAAKLVDNWRLSHDYADLLPASAQLVLAEQKALQIDVFALPDSAAAKLVNNFLQPLLKKLKQVEVNYVDASQNTDLVEQYGIQKQGEMVIRSGADNFQLSSLSYEAFFNGLKRLNISGNQAEKQWIVFIENFSSRPYTELKGVMNEHGYSEWLKQLLATNYQATVLPWQDQMVLPKQAKLIVLAAPELTLTDAQMRWLEVQITQGRSLLWLTDPKFADQQPALALLFDVMRTDAFHQQQLILKDLPPHLINQNFDRPLHLSEVMPFVTANEVLWHNDNKQAVAATSEIKTANSHSTTSRLMVVGDSDFLSNQYLFSGGNLEMSYRLIDWLLNHDDRIDLPSIGVADSQLHFSRQEILWFAGVMLLLLPLLLLLVAGYYWRKTK